MSEDPTPSDGSLSAVEHKQAIARQYSEDWERWKDIYRDELPPGEGEQDPLIAPLARRRDAILGIVDDFAANRPLQVIDVGCGTGVLVASLVDRGHSVAGIDISDKMVEAAQQAADAANPGKATCRVGDIESLPFEDGSFDVAIAAGVLSHQLEDLPSVRELNRIVKPDGIVIVTLPNRFRLRHLLDPYYHYQLAVRFVRRLTARTNRGSKSWAPGLTDFTKSGSVVVRKYYYGQLNQLFRNNGLRVEGTIGLGFGPLTFLGKSVLTPDRWVRFSERLERLTAHRWASFLNMFATYWVIRLDRIPVGVAGTDQPGSSGPV